MSCALLEDRLIVIDGRVHHAVFQIDGPLPLAAVSGDGEFVILIAIEVPGAAGFKAKTRLLLDA